MARASALYRQAYGPDHQMTLRGDSQHGQLLLRLGRVEPGLRMLQAVHDAFHGREPGNSWDAAAATKLGAALPGRGRFEDAEAPLLEARASYA